MTILQRYSLRQFAGPFFLAIVILAFILLMDRLFLLADLLVRKGVPVLIVGEIMVLSLPFVISVCAPLGSLISGIVTYGRMAQDNEIGVIRAAGIPLLKVSWPTIAACLLLMAVMVGFNGYVVPEAQHRVRNLLTDVARKRPALRIREGVFMNDFAQYMIYVGLSMYVPGYGFAVAGDTGSGSAVRNVAIFERKKGQKTPGFMTAPTGRISYTSDDRYMILELFDGEMHEVSDNQTYRKLSFDRHTINVLMDADLVRRDREYRSDQEMLFPMLVEKLRHMNRELADLGAGIARARAESSESEPARLRADELETRLRYKRLESARYQVEFQKKLSLAFSCFFFLLFGAPLGVLLRRGGIGTGFIVGLVFFALYYVLLVAGQNLADAGKLPPFLGMWLPNILLVLPVIELFSRAFFERPLIRRWRRA